MGQDGPGFAQGPTDEGREARQGREEKGRRTERRCVRVHFLAASLLIHFGRRAGAKKKAKVVVKAEPKPSTPAAPTAKKAAPSLAALPSFKKEKKPDVSPAPVDSSNPFLAALSSMGRKKDVENKEGLTTSMAPKGAGKKVKKTVRWAAEADLEKVRWIEERNTGNEVRCIGSIRRGVG